MGVDRPAVEAYRERIRQRQRRATMLTIDIDLNAQDEDDAGALVQTIERLDSAIQILEQADAIVMAAHKAADEPLMDDLGHSMAPMDFADAQSPVTSRDALQFFS